jgi:large conductance mechanosensitive channel
MKFIQEFKEFAVKGNMIDLAIGVIIGAAFNKIVDTMVKNVITPPLGYLTSGVDISDLKMVMREPELNAAGEVIREGVVIEYGIFLEACIDFLIVALTIFLVVKAINTLRRDAEDEKNAKVPTPKDIELLAQIRDQMKETNALLQEQKKG